MNGRGMKVVSLPYAYASCVINIQQQPPDIFGQNTIAGHAVRIQTVCLIQSHLPIVLRLVECLLFQIVDDHEDIVNETPLNAELADLIWTPRSIWQRRSCSEDSHKNKYVALRKAQQRIDFGDSIREIRIVVGPLSRK